jgi:two-component system sensor histidine kinase QseC
VKKSIAGFWAVTARSRLSLRRRLLVSLVLVSFGYWGVIAWLTVRDSVDKVYELFDVHLAQTALALLHVTDPDENETATIPGRDAQSVALAEIFGPWPELPQRIADARARTDRAAAPLRGAGSVQAMHEQYEKHLRYQVWSGDRRLLLKSPNAPEEALAAQDGYSETADADGHVWRHYGVWDKHGDFRIVVSEDHELRNRLVRSIALHTATPLALGLPVLVILLWASIGKGLAPLRQLTREIQARAPDNLTPLDPGHAPREVRPIVGALNTLLARVLNALEGERRFTANAAHELRTPLAAIQAQLHMARVAQDEVARRAALDQLQRGVERGKRLVGQLLALARLDPEQALPDAQAVQLGAVAEAVCAELAPAALARGQTLSLDVPPDAPPVRGNADLLSMLLSNLLDNAIRYTPAGGHIGLVVRRCAQGLQIDVADDGPGIPAEQRERVFDRFYRGDHQSQPGTGLGLAICRRVAELHETAIVLASGSDGRGLVATVTLALAL